jgi:hypothetical protein
MAILAITLVGFTPMYAGSLGINPGDYLNPDGSVSVGLLPNVGLGSAAVDPLASNDLGITGTNFKQRNYFTAGIVLNGGTVGASSTPGTSKGLPQVGAACAANCQGGISAAPAYASGIAAVYAPGNGAPEFALLGDSLASDKSNNSNFWYSLSTGTDTSAGCTSSCASLITIPVGIFDVTTVNTMLNTAGGQTSGGTLGTTDGSTAYAEISFLFDASGHSTVQPGDITYTETMLLVNGVTQRNILDGAGAGYASTLCGDNASVSAGTTCSYTVSDGSTPYSVTVGNEWNGAATVGTHSPVNETMVLDYQSFPVFSEYQSDALVSISILDTGNGTPGSADYSREILSGLTVDQGSVTLSGGSQFSDTPEPSTILMALGAFLATGIAGWNRHRRQAA